MRVSLSLMIIALLALGGMSAGPAAAQEEGWISLFNGETLSGWKANENEQTWSVQDNMIVCDGPRSHLFYQGPVQNHDFENFELKLEVFLRPGANSGVYFHTEYQDSGWPAKGFEVQLNNTMEGEPRKTGGLYAVEDVTGESPAPDNEWFTMHIIVDGNDITVKVNGETTTEFTVTEDYQPPEGSSGRVLDSGTFALQGHDPESKAYFTNIRVKRLPEETN